MPGRDSAAVEQDLEQRVCRYLTSGPRTLEGWQTFGEGLSLVSLQATTPGGDVIPGRLKRSPEGRTPVEEAHALCVLAVHAAHQDRWSLAGALVARARRLNTVLAEITDKALDEIAWTPEPGIVAERPAAPPARPARAKRLTRADVFAHDAREAAAETAELRMHPPVEGWLPGDGSGDASR